MESNSEIPSNCGGCGNLLEELTSVVLYCNCRVPFCDRCARLQMSRCIQLRYMQPIHCPKCNCNSLSFDTDYSYRLAKDETEILEKAFGRLKSKSGDLKANLLMMVDLFKHGKNKLLADLTNEDIEDEELLIRYVIRAEMVPSKRCLRAYNPLTSIPVFFFFEKCSYL